MHLCRRAEIKEYCNPGDCFALYLRACLHRSRFMAELDRLPNEVLNEFDHGRELAEVFGDLTAFVQADFAFCVVVEIAIEELHDEFASGVIGIHTGRSI